MSMRHTRLCGVSLRGLAAHEVSTHRSRALQRHSSHQRNLLGMSHLSIQPVIGIVLAGRVVPSLKLRAGSPLGIG